MQDYHILTKQLDASRADTVLPSSLNPQHSENCQVQSRHLTNMCWMSQQMATESECSPGDPRLKPHTMWIMWEMKAGGQGTPGLWVKPWRSWVWGAAEPSTWQLRGRGSTCQTSHIHQQHNRCPGASQPSHGSQLPVTSGQDLLHVHNRSGTGRHFFK